MEDSAKNKSDDLIFNTRICDGAQILVIAVANLIFATQCLR